MSNDYQPVPTPVYAQYPAPISSLFNPQPVSYRYPHVEVLSDRDATVVQVTAGDITVTGSARRHPDDEYDPETGELLALARAYNKLAVKISRRADGKINHASEILRHKAERKAKKEAAAAAAQEVMDAITKAVRENPGIMAPDRSTPDLYGGWTPWTDLYYHNGYEESEA